MNFVAAVIKITYCIESAKTEEHFKAIHKMIKRLDEMNDNSSPKDKMLSGALALLMWQNADKFNRLKLVNQNK